MKLILIFSIIISLMSCHNSKDNQKALLSDLFNAKKYINQLEDSISQLNSKTDYGFNKFEPITYGKREFIIKSETPYVRVGYLAYNTSTYTDLKYWIDDSTKQSNGTLLYRGKAGIDKIKFDSTYLPHKKALTKGKHTIYGKIRRLENGMKIWDDWQYNYENK